MQLNQVWCLQAEVGPITGLRPHSSRRSHSACEGQGQLRQVRQHLLGSDGSATQGGRCLARHHRLLVPRQPSKAADQVAIHHGIRSSGTGSWGLGGASCSSSFTCHSPRHILVNEWGGEALTAALRAGDAGVAAAEGPGVESRGVLQPQGQHPLQGREAGGGLGVPQGGHKGQAPTCCGEEQSVPVGCVQALHLKAGGVSDVRADVQRPPVDEALPAPAAGVVTHVLHLSQCPPCVCMHKEQLGGVDDDTRSCHIMVVKVTTQKLQNPVGLHISNEVEPPRHVPHQHVILDGVQAGHKVGRVKEGRAHQGAPIPAVHLHLGAHTQQQEALEVLGTGDGAGEVSLEHEARRPHRVHAPPP
mmetsp:Transcript_5312/g.11615  ORF Transcript_5312/g.11615 Transcript_5312/m.11615 type:complete len:359 (-) Transcript_5312:868-1944(-)